MKIYSVNEILEEKTTLHGQRVYLEGILTFETENISLLHWPKSERKSKSIWLEEGRGALRFNATGMKRLAGKKVIVLGEFQSKITSEHDNFYFGFGHLGMWSAKLVATEIHYYKRWHEANGTSET